MELFMQAMGAVNNLVWGPGMLVLLLGTGLYLTLKTNKTPTQTTQESNRHQR